MSLVSKTAGALTLLCVLCLVALSLSLRMEDSLDDDFESSPTGLHRYLYGK